MERNEQKAFIKSIFQESFEQISKKIDSGSLPETWDGLELRKYCHEYIAENFDSARYLAGKRLRSYKNDKIVNNL